MHHKDARFTYAPGSKGGRFSLGMNGNIGAPVVSGGPFSCTEGNTSLKENTREETAVKKLGHTCIECGSGIVEKIEERGSRQFSFERINYACGATLETFQTTNDNLARAIHSGCNASE